MIGIDSDEPGPLLTPDQRRLLDALSDQAALAIERVNLVEDVDRAGLEAERDRLRQALLTSISHDLRTPLASILGSASSLAAGPVPEPMRDTLIRTIQEEAERLNRFIGNLLDMTRTSARAPAARRRSASSQPRPGQPPQEQHGNQSHVHTACLGQLRLQAGEEQRLERSRRAPSG